MLSIIVSLLIFLVVIVLIFSEKLNRTIASMAGAVIMVVTGLILHFYTEDQAVSTIDFNTLGLLLGMMIIVSVLEPTGFFQFLAVKVGKLSKGKPVRMLLFLGTITTVVSMFLDNVTTVVLIAPVTILLCEILGLNAQPFLMAEALLSDTGGVATLGGDPPNILIGSAADFTFLDFLTHSLPIVLIVWFSALGILLVLFRKELSQKPSNLDALFDLNPKDALTDPKATRSVLIIIGCMIALFLLEEWLHIRPALVALGGAAAALVWVRPSIVETLKRVQWEVLIFFGALFVVIGGMQYAGVFDGFINIAGLIKDLPPVVLGLIILWVVGLLSMVVDNVPITIALIPVIQSFGNIGIPTSALWWALVFGAGFGGNGTIIGSTANIVVSSLSEKTRNPITPITWSKRGLPVMIGTTLIASVFYILLFGYLSK
jgi:Na+/H+ antiporter NhaD/arsenite permease-like protein